MSDVTRNIKAFQDNLKQQVLDARMEALERILGAAVELVPVSTGELRDSGHIANDAGVVFDADHALLVHESHDTGFKFLVRAANQTDILEIVERYIRELT